MVVVLRALAIELDTRKKIIIPVVKISISRSLNCNGCIAYQLVIWMDFQ